MANRIQIDTTPAPFTAPLEASRDGGATFTPLTTVTVGTAKRGFIENVPAATYAIGSVRVRAVGFPASAASSTVALTVAALTPTAVPLAAIDANKYTSPAFVTNSFAEITFAAPTTEITLGFVCTLAPAHVALALAAVFVNNTFRTMLAFDAQGATADQEKLLSGLTVGDVVRVRNGMKAGTAGTYLKYVKSTAATAFTTLAAPARRVVIATDSIGGQQPTDAPTTAWTMLARQDLAVRNPAIRLTADCVGGDTFTARYGADLTQAQRDAYVAFCSSQCDGTVNNVFIDGMGRNDAAALTGLTAAQFGASYVAWLDAFNAQRPDVRVLLLLPVYSDNARIAEFRTAKSGAATGRAYVTVLDGNTLTTVASMSDGIHLTNAGAVQVANGVLPVLNPMIDAAALPGTALAATIVFQETDARVTEGGGVFTADVFTGYYAGNGRFSPTLGAYTQVTIPTGYTRLLFQGFHPAVATLFDVAVNGVYKGTADQATANGGTYADMSSLVAGDVVRFTNRTATNFFSDQYTLLASSTGAGPAPVPIAVSPLVVQQDNALITHVGTFIADVFAGYKGGSALYSTTAGDYAQMTLTAERPRVKFEGPADFTGSAFSVLVNGVSVGSGIQTHTGAGGTLYFNYLGKAGDVVRFVRGTGTGNFFSDQYTFSAA